MFGVLLVEDAEGRTYRVSRWLTSGSLVDHARYCTHRNGDLVPELRPISEEISGSVAPPDFKNGATHATVRPPSPLELKLHVPLTAEIVDAHEANGDLEDARFERVDGKWFWNPFYVHVGNCLDGKGMSKALLGNGYGNGYMPMDIVPGAVGNVTDALGAPAFSRPLNRPLTRLEEELAEGRTHRGYLNIGKGAKRPRGLRVFLHAIFLNWCAWHREKTSECKCEMRLVAMTLLDGSVRGSRCKDETCACCQAGTSWGGTVASLKMWSEYLQRTFSVQVKFIVNWRKDGSASIQTSWPNRGHIDTLMLHARSEDVFPEFSKKNATSRPQKLFMCKTVRAALILMHQSRQHFFRLNNERDPVIFRRRSYEVGVVAVTNLHANLIANGAKGPTPTVKSNAEHYPSEASQAKAKPRRPPPGPLAARAPAAWSHSRQFRPAAASLTFVMFLCVCVCVLLGMPTDREDHVHPLDGTRPLE